MLNWAWAYLTWDRGPRIIFGDRRPRTAVLPDGCADGNRPGQESARAAS
jgi:hypothetical protein